MRRIHLAGALAMALLTAGCLGNVTAATIPMSTLNEKGWTVTGDDRRTLAGGLAQAVTIDHAPEDERRELAAGVTVATATNVPLYDESRHIDEAIDRVEARHDVRFENPTQVPFQLTNLDRSVEATEYDVAGAPVEGKALVYHTDCRDFVAVAAWGATGSGGLFDDGPPPYQDARDVAAAVIC